MLLKTATKVQRELAANTRRRRLEMNLTQEGLATRAGVPLPTLRKFEQKHTISLASFLKLQQVLGGLEEILRATAAPKTEFSSIDEVLAADAVPTRQRGRRK